MVIVKELIKKLLDEDMTDEVVINDDSGKCLHKVFIVVKKTEGLKCLLG